MDNQSLARIFEEIADILEIKSENPFKIRAYRNAADVIGTWPDTVAGLADTDLRTLPGVGKDLASKIREIADTGRSTYHAELLAEFPPTLLDLLRLQGLGPKTVALLHRQLGISTLDDLERAARDGRLHDIRGMGTRKEELILRAIAERRRREGRHLLADVDEIARRLIDDLRQSVRAGEFIPVGSLRRGSETCGDLDILAIGSPPDVMQIFTEHPLVERVLGRGDTKSSILLGEGLQADLRLVGDNSRGAALQYFTGSKAHNVALRDRALRRGYKLNEYGLYRLSDGVVIAGDTEEGIYQALDLPFIHPELREGRGELEAAEQGSLPALIERNHIRGDIHSHTTATDGRDDIETMAQAARAAGLEYLAVTEHSKALAMANGLDEARTLEHARRIRQIGRQFSDVRLLAGIECDIRADGSLDLDSECLAELDLVIASVHSAFGQDEAQMTARIVRAIESPWVDVIGHPTGRRILKREPHRLDFDAILRAAERAGVALEINCQVDRLDLSDLRAQQARQRGVKLTIASDAHARDGFDRLRWGATVARRAWLEPGDVLNTRPVEEFRKALRRARSARM